MVAFFWVPTYGQRSNKRINGSVIGISRRFPGRPQPFSLIVNNFTSDAQVSELNSALQRSQDDLLRTLSQMNVGIIQIGHNVGVPANAIITAPWENGGTRITVLFERNVGFYERRFGTRSADFRFGYAELFLDRNGRGEGTFIAAARVNLRSDNTWEVVDFGVFPARLMGLRSSGQVVPG